MNPKQMEEQQKAIIENYIQAYNQFDVAGMIKDLSDTVIFENITNNEVDLRTDGKEAFQKQAEMAKQYFQQRAQTIEAWDFQENKVIIDISYQGILAIDLPNGMKAGDTLRLNGQSEFEFRDDKIVSIRDKS